MKIITPFLFVFTFLTTQAGVCYAQSGSLEATVLSRKGNTVELQRVTSSSVDLQSGTVADMSKHFEEQLGKMTMNGWLTVAKVKCLSAAQQRITVEVLEEKSEITVNGEKVDHFKPGKRMKLEWPAKPSREAGQHSPTETPGH